MSQVNTFIHQNETADQVNERRAKFIEQRNRAMVISRQERITEDRIDHPGMAHLWPTGHKFKLPGQMAQSHPGGYRAAGQPQAARGIGKRAMTAAGGEAIGPLTADEAREYFGRCVVITLRDRPERLERFMTGLPADWPFGEIAIFRAMHGDQMGVPEGWGQGGGAYGCLLSHRRILEDAVRDGVKRLLVMEEDALFCEGFAGKALDFLAKVPADWDQVMFGGQRMADGQWRTQSEGVDQVVQCERTHCYALQGEAITGLLRWWNRVGMNAHCDWAMGDWQERGAKVFVPAERFLVGQAADMSAIRGSNEGERWWHGKGGAPRAGDAPKPRDFMNVENWQVFFHVAAMNGWREITKEILAVLQESGVCNGRILNVGVVGDNACGEVENICQEYGITAFAVYLGELTKYEVPTIEWIWNHVNNNDGEYPVMYLHTKGVSYKNTDLTRTRWRRAMLAEVVLDWKKQLDALRNADVTGASLTDNVRHGFPPHIAGNFWIARSGHLRRLPNPEEFASRELPGAFGYPWRRFSPEMWPTAGGAVASGSMPPNLAWWDNESFTKDQCDRITSLLDRKFPMPSKIDLDKQYGPDAKHFVHSGKYGDLIYALPAIRAMGGWRAVDGRSRIRNWNENHAGADRVHSTSFDGTELH